MLAVWSHHGRPPMHKEMSEPPSTVGGKAYIRRFGTWNKALAAFVDRIGQDNEPDARERVSVLASVSPPLLVSVMPEARRVAEDARDIPLGLRFRVLHRDRFKCVLCGDHPARNTECVLHLDHLIPWSKGGKTKEHNLRTPLRNMQRRPGQSLH